jgi:hypothetical protein
MEVRPSPFLSILFAVLSVAAVTSKAVPENELPTPSGLPAAASQFREANPLYYTPLVFGE